MRILGAATAALMVGVVGANAADIYAPPPVAEVIYSPAPAFSWTGGYVGGLFGYEWGDAKVDKGPSLSPDGWMGGLYGGYNFQTNDYAVFGLEGDISLSGAEDKANGYTVENKWNGTVRARVGLAFDRFMLYGTGGLAVGQVEVKTGGNSDSSTRAGWTIGAGMEAAITNNLVGRLEYRYTDLGSHNYDVSPKRDVDFQSSQVMVGLGYKF